MPHKCSGTKKDGQECGAHPIVGSEYCFFHDPDSANQRKAASAAGGKGIKLAALPADAPAIQVCSLDDVSNLNETNLRLLCTGKIDHRIANSITYLANILLQLLEAEESERRIRNAELLSQGGAAAEASNQPAPEVDSAPEMDYIPLRTLADIRGLIERVINLMLKGQIDHRISNSIGLVARAQCSILLMRLAEREMILMASE